MTALAFLAIAVAISVIGVSINVLRNRKPTGWDSGIQTFAEEMRALAPEDESTPPGPTD
jgi:hypothetical protein